MSERSMPAENVKVLRPKLQEAQKALEAALDEACETDVASADSTDLLRLEESLTEARAAARNAIDVLRRLHRDRDTAEEVGSESNSEAHRVFLDDQGVQWDAFSVYPSRPKSGRSTLPAPYDKGWLAIQCDSEIRRVTPIPEGWRELSRSGLCELVSKTAAAPRRARSQDPRPNDPETRA